MKPTTGGNFKAVKLPPAGVTPARCYSVIDIGTIPNVFNGQLVVDKPKIRKVYLTFEMPAYKAKFTDTKGEEPFVVGEEYTYSLSEKANLRKLMMQWMNRDITPTEEKTFDVGQKCPGKVCMLSFTQNRKKKFIGKEIAEVTNENTALKLNGIMQLPDAIVCPPQMNPTLVWDWEAVASSRVFNVELFDKIPNFIRTKMKESDEYKKYGPKESGSSQVEAQQESTDPDPEPMNEKGW